MQDPDLELLIKAAQSSGEIATGFAMDRLKKWDKDEGAGPVTEADLAVNAYLEDTLQAARPDYGWLSEETEDSEARLKKSRAFVIDPIDGTRSFIEGS
ncbi:inositol monophosphatase family protein, partial [Lentibacter algarum]